MHTIQAVVADPHSAERLVIRAVEPSSPAPSEAIVRVAAISLNRGETRRALQNDSTWRDRGEMPPVLSNSPRRMALGHQPGLGW